MPAHAGPLDAIALQTAVDGTLIIPGRTLASQLASHRVLHFAVFLKRLVAGQGDFLILPVAQTWPLQSYFAPRINDEPWLMAMPVRRLLPPLAHFLVDLRSQDSLNEGQAQLGCERLDIRARSRYEFFHWQLCFQRQSLPIFSFSLGLFLSSSIGSHRWFSWLFVSYFNRPPCLMDGRRTTSNFNYHRDIPRLRTRMRSRSAVMACGCLLRFSTLRP